MPRPCTVCRHPDREAIEERARIDGVKPTARDLGVSSQALYRHMTPEHRSKVAEPPDGADLAPPPAAKPREAKSATQVFEAPVSVAPPPAPSSTPPTSPPTRTPRKVKERRPPAPATLPTTAAGWKAYFAKRIRGGTLNGARVVEHLRANHPDLDVHELVESMEQAAMEIRFMRGTELVRRLTLVSRAEYVYRAALAAGDHKAALRVLEFIAKTDGLTADLSPLAALMASEAWRVIAPGMMTRFPDAYAFAVTTIAAEEQKKRQALAPPVTVQPDAE
jgi:hypothetical protein